MFLPVSSAVPGVKKKLQGKSGKGRSGKPHFYYAHPGRCAKGGLHSIEADDAHNLIDEWLRTVSQDKSLFMDLLDRGRSELGKRLRALKSQLKRLDHEDAALRKKLHNAATESLSKDGPATKALMEKEADRLMDQLQQNERETERSHSEAEGLKAILDIGTAALFRAYSDRIKRYLNSPARDKCHRVFELLQTLTLADQGLQIELTHPNGRSAGEAIALVRDRIPLPGILLLKNRAYLRKLYRDENLSARAIARRIGVGASTASAALQKHGLIIEAKQQKKRAQQVPFGHSSKNGKLVPNRKEQQVIRTARQLRAAGLTYRDIAAYLNRKLIATKRGGIWEAMTVQKILLRATKKSAKQAPKTDL